MIKPKKFIKFNIYENILLLHLQKIKINYGKCSAVIISYPIFSMYKDIIYKLIKS